MRLADVVATAIIDKMDPAGALARVYAQRIDDANHVRSALRAALDQLRIAAEIADEQSTEGKIDDVNMKAFHKVAAALSAVTVASDLGPKLLATLDAMVLTAKARAEIGQALPKPQPAGGGLDALRAEEDELARRRALRTG